jgi:hypothetical protein
VWKNWIVYRGETRLGKFAAPNRMAALLQAVLIYGAGRYDVRAE